jgi:hypothetical protein
MKTDDEGVYDRLESIPATASRSLTATIRHPTPYSSLSDPSPWRKTTTCRGPPRIIPTSDRRLGAGLYLPFRKTANYRMSLGRRDGNDLDSPDGSYRAGEIYGLDLLIDSGDLHFRLSSTASRSSFLEQRFPFSIGGGTGFLDRGWVQNGSGGCSTVPGGDVQMVARFPPALPHRLAGGSASWAFHSHDRCEFPGLETLDVYPAYLQRIEAKVDLGDLLKGEGFRFGSSNKENRTGHTLRRMIHPWCSFSLRKGTSNASWFLNADDLSRSPASRRILPSTSFWAWDVQGRFLCGPTCILSGATLATVGPRSFASVHGLWESRNA